MEKDGFKMLGFLSLAFLYLFLGLGCLVATAIMTKIGVKNSMILGSVCDCIQILFCIVPALKKEHQMSGVTSGESIFFSDGFIYFAGILSSMLDGFGDAI